LRTFSRTCMDRRFCFLSVLLCLWTLSGGCASLRPAPPPLTPPEIEGILQRMDAQKDRVSTFFSLGTVVLKKWLVESEEARILVVGRRHPMGIKVEITHPWGAPVLHVLLDRGRLEAFSYSDATLYTGQATPETLARFMPSPPDLESAWAILRGYPAPRIAGEVISREGRVLTCGDGCSDPPWTLHMRPDTLEPRKLAYPGSGLEVDFGTMREQDGIFYAEEVDYRDGKRGGNVVIRNDRVEFNREIPETIFRLAKPPVYRTVDLDEETP